jgi:hypothetical protein
MEGALPVSSSRIRAAITCGDFALAEAMLGRPFALDLCSLAQGVAGRVLPPDGTYSGRVYYEASGKMKAATLLIAGGSVVPEDAETEGSFEFAT